VDFASFDLKVHGIQGLNPCVAFADILHGKKEIAHRFPLAD
jgi:hypothetical protein